MTTAPVDLDALEAQVVSLAANLRAARERIAALEAENKELRYANADLADEHRILLELSRS